MSVHPEPEEVAAVLDGMADSDHVLAQVAARDFHRPQRFPASRLAEIEEALLNPIASLGVELQETCGAKLSLRLTGVSEASADGLLDEVSLDTVILRFFVDGRPGWLLWDAAELAALAESILGAGVAKGEVRPLSKMERQLVGQPLDLIVTRLARVLGLEAGAFEFLENSPHAGDWKDSTTAETAHPPDAHRLVVELDVARPDAEGASARMYFPTKPEVVDASSHPPTDLPTHLAPVSVEVAVKLATAEITLAQLLELEEGDVIPTDARVEENAVLLVEEHPFARVVLGAHRGRFAVRIAPADDAGTHPQ